VRAALLIIVRFVTYGQFGGELCEVALAEADEQLVDDLANEPLMDKRCFDDSDYSVVVKKRGSSPNSWKWEIYRSSRQHQALH
jgi:hypothetical protein